MNTPIHTNKYVYHRSNPIFRNEIELQGLVPKGKSETWLSDPNFDGELYIITNKEIPKEAITLIYKGTGKTL